MDKMSETAMTIDDMIMALNKAKKELGGDKTLQLELNYQGNSELLQLYNLEYSRFTGLTCKINKLPWWMYPKKKNCKDKL